MTPGVVPDYTQSLEFLRRWLPTGPWVITAVPQKGKVRSLPTATFSADEEKALLAWLKKRGKTDNLYFHVNPVRYPLTKKAQREDIAALAWGHVDVDPRVGEDIPTEQERIKDLFTENLPEGIPEPTCVVFSGGGYQAFWRLEEPMVLDGDLALCEKAKLYNLRLELEFEADSCHNVDRIMRLPGTVNRPNERKQKKGRKPALAYVVFFNDNTYRLDEDLIPAVEVQDKDSGAFTGGTGVKVEVSGNVKRLASLDELGSKVPDYCKVIINQGNDPDEPGKYKSRSDAVWYVVCELVRSGIDDQTIFSVITDPGFAISGHILDQDNPERSAKRQIERARQNAIHPKLAELNDKHAVILDYGGKCVIVTEVPTVIPGRTRLSAQSVADFKTRYRNEYVEIPLGNNKKQMRKLGEWWLDHPNRRQYEQVAFAPDLNIPGCYNLWRGFAFQPMKGDCALLLEHIRENICSGDEAHYAYLMGWMAQCVQKPASPGHTAVVLRGGQGTGKSFFAKAFGALFGRHFRHITDPKHLVGSFNAHQRDALVVFSDEAFFAGDKKHASKLKGLVTEEFHQVEAKGKDAEEAHNFIHLIMASNEDWVVPAGTDERRFFFLDVAEHHKQDSHYFARIQQQLEAGGYEAFLYVLRTWSLEGFNVRNAPKTAGLEEQKGRSLGPAESWWYQKLLGGDILPGAGWPVEVYSDELVLDFFQTLRWDRTARSTQTTLGYFLKKAFPKGWHPRKRTGKSKMLNTISGMQEVKQPWMTVLPPLDACRKIWDECHWEVDWPSAEVSVASDKQETVPF